MENKNEIETAARLIPILSTGGNHIIEWKSQITYLIVCIFYHFFFFNAKINIVISFFNDIDRFFPFAVIFKVPG